MANNLIRIQRRPAAATWETLYTVAADMMNAAILVVNTETVATTIRMAIRPLGAAYADSQLIAGKEQVIPANTTMLFQMGYVLLATDVVDVYSTLANCNFHFSGQEKS